MGIYLTPEFDGQRKDARINDKTLCKAAKAIFDGLPGDHLGKFTWKKRLAVPGLGGSSNGARSIVFFNHGGNVFFFDMYLKSELSKKSGKELEKDEIDAYCAIAEDFISMTPEKITDLLKSNELIEVTCDD
ncbi:type II toxin-antitoxin system RelE/ParE family toxin [Citrobacter koseri]|uniref:type II toxin-antitoxin system RelE/ParE family toxin n=1 Tax=Citrobacter koseri TaxID=545 RepID=UPI001F23F47D|nr:type II toxin-antitoxin system RelE/ParE family toxin [Citrobacter koseri]